MKRVFDNQVAFAVILSLVALGLAVSGLQGAPLPAAKLAVAHGPIMPPDPWDLTVAHGPIMPPDPWD